MTRCQEPKPLLAQNAAAKLRSLKFMLRRSMCIFVLMKNNDIGPATNHCKEACNDYWIKSVWTWKQDKNAKVYLI